MNKQNLKRLHSGAENSNSDNIKNRQQLTIFDHRHRLVEVIKNTKNVVLISSTGTGKTTQLPQFLYQANIHKNKVIAITQPRRVAAISVANRVAEETDCNVGGLVGYSVRFEDTTSEQTKIKYLTDGMLVREAITDPTLKRYSVVILDEAHERSLNTDILFGVVKAAQKKRLQKGIVPFKVIVMSATIDPEPFVEFLGAAETQTVFIEGRRHPIEVLSSPTPVRDYVQDAAAACLQLHKSVPQLDRAVIIFLTGEEEIDRCCGMLRRAARALAHRSGSDQQNPNLVIFPLFAALPQGQQMKAMTVVCPNARKVIVSTNIAETSVTIPGVQYVIDCGYSKQRHCEQGSGLEALIVRPISQAQAWQRAGRAGRETSGWCYRLYTDAEYAGMRTHPLPELQRCNLSAVMLQLVAMGIQAAAHFDWVSPPTELSITSAVGSLRDLGAVFDGEQKETLQLTDLGKMMVSFPVDPRLARVLVMAAEKSCLVEILTVCSMLYIDSVFYVPANKREDYEGIRTRFLSPDGDLGTLLNVYRGFMAVKTVKDRVSWCRENYVNHTQMHTVVRVRKQLKAIASQLGLAMKSCHDNLDLIGRCFLAGYSKQVAVLTLSNEARDRGGGGGTGWYVCASEPGLRLHLHPSSALFSASCPPPLLLFTQCVRTNKAYMRQACRLRPEWIRGDPSVETPTLE